MASAMRADRTPSPSPPGIRTPPAPRLGYHDDWQPYAPRKSARLANRTPSPRAPRRQAGSPQPSKNAAAAAKNAFSSSMMSPMPSPRKRRQPPTTNSARRASGSLTAEGTSSAAASLGLGRSTPRKTASSATFSAEHGMLPTPSKTPSKAPTKESVQGLQSFARNLFQSEDELMPNRKRSPKKYSGMTLDSFTAEPANDSIEIFTDTRERVPERDESAENPFIGEAVSEPTKRRSKRRNVSVPGEKAQTVEEASERQDGMVYVFRGKRFFRKFAPEMEAPEEMVDNEMASPLSRSNIKPKLLFPAQQKETQPSADDVDEEATTDIEDNAEVEVEEHLLPQTPSKIASKGMATPQAPRFAPVSPPDTKRTTRSTNKLFEDEATPIKKKDRRSPFDTWPRTKDRKDTGSKRQAEPMFAPAKRTKA